MAVYNMLFIYGAVERGRKNLCFYPTNSTSMKECVCINIQSGGLTDLIGAIKLHYNFLAASLISINLERKRERGRKQERAQENNHHHMVTLHLLCRTHLHHHIANGFLPLFLSFCRYDLADSVGLLQQARPDWFKLKVNWRSYLKM